MDESHSFEMPNARAKDRSRKTILISVAAAFVLGAALMTFLSSRDWFGQGAVFRLRDGDSAAEQTVTVSPEPLASAVAGKGNGSSAAKEARQATQAVEQVVQQQGGLDQRVAAMEQRLTRLDLQAQAASGNAARAEGLLIAFAARRAIERGAPLGYLGDQLRLRFGDAKPNAVQTVIDAAQDPVTLDQLLARFDGLTPKLLDTPSDEGAFEWFGRELSELFVVRTQDTPSPAAEKRLERARLFLETGRPELAVSEVRQLPNAAEAGDWLDDAERYASAQRALELLETTAVLEPRELRDGAGNTVEQLSPVGGD